jgi:hypothetical protein
MSGGAYANDFSTSPVSTEEAFESIENEMRMNPGEVTSLIVPGDMEKEDILELLESLKEAVEEAMKE